MNADPFESAFGIQRLTAQVDYMGDQREAALAVRCSIFLGELHKRITYAFPFEIGRQGNSKRGNQAVILGQE